MDVGTPINTHDKSDKISTLSAIGLYIALVGLLFAVFQGLYIGSEAQSSDQANLLASLCWIAVGGVVVLFGISLVIAGQKK